MMIADIRQTLTLIIRRITGESTAVVYRKYLSLFEALTYKLCTLPEPMIDSLNNEIEMLLRNIFFDNYIYALSDNSFKIERLKNWLYSVFQNQDQVEYFIKDIMPAHINIYFENKNSDKTCRILLNRIIQECKRLYNNLDEFDISNLSLTLSTVTCEGMIKILKNLKSIGAVNNDAISFTFFVNEILMKC